MGKTNIPEDIKQFEINYICSCLLICHIRTSHDLNTNYNYLIAQINQNPQIFKPGYTTKQCVAILQKAISAFNEANEYSIHLNDKLIREFENALKEGSSRKLTPIPTTDDLSKVTKGYDRFTLALQKKQEINKNILTALERKEFVVIPQVILGSGDTGTTLWLEKYAAHRETTASKVSKKELPAILMIGEDSGSWKHDYTLAQPHSILERTSGKENPSVYLSSEYYQQNPYANGRHVFQANQVNLAQTNAPLLKAKVLRIEKKNNHLADWKSAEQDYRLIVDTPHGVKTIYTNEINMCTGLGPARNAIDGTLLDSKKFAELSKFDPQKKFTPVVDGNQFILTDTEEHGTGARDIVIYGGGGTAAACYRKGFFGDDVRTQDKEFNKENQTNKVRWIAKQFEKAGTGKLASTAIKTATNRDELMQAELLKIEHQPNGKLLLTFSADDKGTATSAKPFQVECDQLIYSIGQDDSAMRAVCKEIDADLKLVFDENNMVLNVSSSDKKVIFFGAAAMAVREKEYMEATWKWLHEENIGGDVGPGSMPPSRAQIKRYNFLQGIGPVSINANMDSKYLVLKFLENAGVKPIIAASFVDDLLEARKSSTSGATHKMFMNLLKKHDLDKLFEIKGHAHLVVKKTKEEPAVEQQKHPLLTWLGPQRKTADASIFVSSVSSKSAHDSIVEKEEQGVQFVTEIRT